MKKTVWILAFTLLTAFRADDGITIKGVVLVHYNASFNQSNNYTDIVRIKDAKVMKSWIDEHPEIKSNERIRSVPTLILYKDGREVHRWEAGISLELTVPYIQVQREIDKLTGANKF